jgi:putative addiction module component (TIGR02574 family)
MSQIDDILQQALALPPADRASVVAALQESLSPKDGGVDAIAGNEFLAELHRRSAAFKDGSMPARPAAEVVAELRRPTPSGRC